MSFYFENHELACGICLHELKFNLYQTDKRMDIKSSIPTLRVFNCVNSKCSQFNEEILIAPKKSDSEDIV